MSNVVNALTRVPTARLTVAVVLCFLAGGPAGRVDARPAASSGPASRGQAAPAVISTRSASGSRRAARAAMPPLLLASASENRRIEARRAQRAAMPPLRGGHVLIGVVDTGIDYRNADFRNADGSTRIVTIWDQTGSGNPPAGFHFGYECGRAAINSGTCPERDTDGHGTHVAGIAASNGRSGGRFARTGLASSADIIAVKTDFSESNVIAAWKYLVAAAKRLREPIVINNSFGDRSGPHDGTVPEDRALDALSGPGVVFVTSAGNDGHQGLHTDGSLAAGTTRSVAVTSLGSSPELTLAVFYPERDTVTATLTNTRTGQTVGPVSAGSTIDARSDRGETQISIDARRRDNVHNSVVVDLNRLASAPPLTGTWRLTLTARRVAARGRYDAWLLTGQDGAQALAHPDESDTLSTPADAHSVIAVADYATRVQWTDRAGQTYQACDYTLCADGTLRRGDIAFHSSIGPTADGRQKPDVAAPGVLISSSLSSNVQICRHTASDTDNCVDSIFITKDGKHMIDTGTSMSSAYVTGVVALMLQADPALGPKAIDDILRTTARHDRYTGGAAWTPTFGAGKVDPAAAVRRAIIARGKVPAVQSTVVAEASQRSQGRVL